MPTRKRRIFVSFDFDNDLVLYNFIVGQARLPDSPFQVADWSLKEAAPQAQWEAEAREKIKRSDNVIIMVGPYTHRAPGVLKEIRIARELRKPIFQVISYKDSQPKPVPNAGRVYRWDWSNLKNLLAPVPLKDPFRTRDPFTARRFL